MDKSIISKLFSGAKLFFLFQAFLCLFLTIGVGVGTVQAQTPTAKADKHYNDFDYALALEEYKKLLTQNEPSLHIIENIAHCYRHMNLPEEAEFWYRQTISFPNSSSENLLYFANACRQNGKYAEAKQIYKLFAQREPGKQTEVEKLIASCDWAMQTLARPEPVEVYLDSALNTEFADFSPVFFRNGLVFSSDRLRAQSTADQRVYGWTGTAYIQLYFAERKGNTWGNIKALEKSINTQYHNATATFSPNQNEIFFTRTKQVHNKVLPEALAAGDSWQRYSKNDKFINRLEIYSATYKNDKWQDVKPFTFNKGDSYSVGHPALSPDGQVLYFASDMPGGFGQTDIYFSERQKDGTWSTPKNAGPAINTPGKEVFPVVHANGALYFSSDGHLGMGGLDIFSAEGSLSNWSNLKNLQHPFNSPRDDFGLIYESDGRSGYLSSNREEGGGSDNIYRFKPLEIPCKLAGVTYMRTRSRNGQYQVEPVEDVQLEVTVVGEEGAAPFKLMSDENGHFLFEVQTNRSYMIKGSKKGFLNRTYQVTPDCRKVTDTVQVEMVMERDTPNRPIVIENIYYDLDKYDLRPEAIVELDKVVAMLRDNPTVKIELSSHTDSRESHRYNQILSDMRASVAVKYIISQGIDPKRVVDKGYGETKLLNHCKDGVSCSEEEHQLNRRTEFKILKK
ncbi:OmpA family protein [Rufibacter roseus]|uniref:OmpA family protein n=1 Tax=Rufibacter roseus TaxID=1567108 RepID=A0ABW2DF17_9BACT|nr:OmpA family protein [Rufibacter roseus]